MVAALPQAALVMERGPDAAPLSPRARSLALDALEWLREQKSFSVSRKTSQEIFDHSATRQIEVELAGELESYLDSGVRKIPVTSIARRLIALAIASHPVDGEPTKARQPKARFKKQHRESTPQELAALKRANDARAEGKQRRLLEDKQRREAKVAARV
jgi:hypothetical protein